MNKRNFLHIPLCVLLIATACSPLYSQTQTPVTQQLPVFIRQMDSLMMQAYKLRDIPRYHRLLDTLLSTWRELPPAEQKNYSRSYYNAFYNLSCTYALLNQKTAALNYLEKSIRAGYYDYTHLQQDKDLDCIRKEKRFTTLIEPLRKTGDYLYILRRAGQYNSKDTSSLPAFTYQSATQPELAALRKAFNLDSIAGKGSEVSKVLNLLHWIHNLVPHDGNHPNPAVMNAMNMIAVCKRDNRGLNCRGLATVLNECYLSMGFRSRFVTCLPKDSLRVDPDCHVINMVYIPSLKKWIWVDPTQDAYVMNEKGELLGIEEVRQRIISNQPLILNPEANWNHQVSATKENYLYYYMAKNLYILQCPVNSEYDTETMVKGKTYAYIQLYPLDYFKQSPRKAVGHNERMDTNYVYYTTNNPAAFWQAPEND